MHTSDTAWSPDQVRKILQTVLPVIAGAIGATVKLTDAQVASLAMVVVALWQAIDRDHVLELADFDSRGLFQTKTLWASVAVAVAGLFNLFALALSRALGVEVAFGVPDSVPALAQVIALILSQYTMSQGIERASGTLHSTRRAGW